jgi:hypothetical protein
LGLLLHHADMEDEDMAATAELLDLMAAHGSARCLSMVAVLEEIDTEVAA